jgi:CRP/FNR family cyclic AMP-dependent transcriptional regulator
MNTEFSQQPKPLAAELAAALGLFSASMQRLARLCEPRRYAKGTLLIQEGDRGDTLYLILKGELRAFSAGEYGREIIYGDYGPGEYLGEMSLDGGLRSASVITLTASTCIVLTREVLLAHIAEEPEFAFELLAKVIRRARNVTLSAKRLALNDVYGRLRILLTALPTEQNGQLPAKNDQLTHKEIASRIGCSREMVSRVLKDLEKGGYIAQKRGQLQVLRALPPRW